MADAAVNPASRQQRTHVVDVDSYEMVKRLKSYKPPKDLPFHINKIGHVVLNCSNLERSVKFYTELLGFKVSDVYPEEMMPGGMVFLRCASDHHGVGLVGSLPGESETIELNHMAFEVSTLDEVLLAAKRLKEAGAVIDFEGRRRAGVQIAVEFRDPDGHRLEIYWGVDQIGSDDKIRPSSEWKGAHSFKEAIDNPVRGQDTRLRDPSLLKS
jgi:catechol 2,3-dioxygenase